ncbi:hypothetical protein ACVGOW_18280 [Pseudonocardia saturnea]
MFANSGYVSEAAFTQAHPEKLRLLAPVTDTRAMRDGGDPAGDRQLGDVPQPPAGNAADDTTAAGPTTAGAAARADYRQRGTIEPVFGQFETRHRMTRSSRRGITAVTQRMAPRLRRTQPAQAPRPPPRALTPPPTAGPVHSTSDPRNYAMGSIRPAA